MVLLVNVASKCDFTPQYAGLEALYEKYKDRGLVIVGIPANNFAQQEPGTNEEIKKFPRRERLETRTRDLIFTALSRLLRGNAHRSISIARLRIRAHIGSANP